MFYLFVTPFHEADFHTVDSYQVYTTEGYKSRAKYIQDSLTSSIRPFIVSRPEYSQLIMPLTTFEPNFDPALVDKVKALVQDFGGCNDPNKALKLSARFENHVDVMVRPCISI